jgi:hypothetical protein
MYNSHLAAKLVLDFTLFDSFWSFIADDREQLLDTHDADTSRQSCLSSTGIVLVTNLQRLREKSLRMNYGILRSVLHLLSHDVQRDTRQSAEIGCLRKHWVRLEEPQEQHNFIIILTDVD